KKSESFSLSPMDPALLERLVRLMNDHDVTSLEVRDGAQRVSLKRGPQVVMGNAPQMSYTSPAPAPAPSASNSAGSASAVPAPVNENEGLVPIKSPMVGTFYSSPSPDAKPFVNVGTTINEDSDVCVIEAMKVFNNIKAEAKGTIAKVCVQNGKPVEFGTVLFLVKP
ncbi:MAG TPA: acetyl-CoA carboxylase biotin carboxyl carrier protein, partial [Tepidisphaeraceae bacterium]|nr:acetyl-CoA carboxylase biotin carboxyl carrier protein [Tepidisphaeraceae bacterium]